MSHFVPEKFSDSESLVNKLAYQAKSVVLDPIDKSTFSKMISNLESSIEGTKTLEVILKHRREEKVILRTHLQKIVFKDVEE